MEEAATPFPSEETTPPVTKIYFGAILTARVALPGLFALHRSDVRIIIVGTRNSVKSNSPLTQNGFFSGILEVLAPKPFSIGPLLKFPGTFQRRDKACIPVQHRAHVHVFQVTLSGDATI
jgi:hypothetical protein